MNSGTLDISWGSIFKVAIGAFLFYLIFLVRDILVLFFFALIISVLLSPAIKFLMRLKIPRIFASMLVYLSIFGFLGLIIFWTAPMFVSEIEQFSQLFPQYFERIAPTLQSLGIEAFESMESFTEAIGLIVQDASSDILSALGLLFGGIGTTIFILLI